MNWIEDFWADGNWGEREMRKSSEAFNRIQKHRADELNRIREEFFRKQAQESFNKAKNEAYAKFGYGKWHGGPCCPRCVEDFLDAFHCCCNDGDYPLENKDYQAKYPPVNGMLPKEWDYFGPKTKERYLKRFRGEISDEEYTARVEVPSM